MDSYILKERKSDRPSIKKIFTDNIEHDDSEPSIKINGKKVSLRYVKPIEPIIPNRMSNKRMSNKGVEERKSNRVVDKIKDPDFEEKLVEVFKNIDKASNRALDKLIEKDTLEDTIDKWKKLKKLFPGIEIPYINRENPGELQRLQDLYKIEKLNRMSGTINMYKWGVVVLALVIEGAGAFMEYEFVDGMVQLHINNIDNYHNYLCEMCIESDEKGMFESLSPFTKLLFTMCGTTLLYGIMRSRGYDKSMCLSTSSTIGGLATGNKSLQDVGLAFTGGLDVYGLAQTAMSFIAPAKDKPKETTRESQKEKKEEDEEKKDVKKITRSLPRVVRTN